MRVVCAAAVALSFPSAALAKEPAPPTSKWVVNFSDAQCVATRQYGEDFLVVKVPPLGDVVQLALFTKGSVSGPDQVEGSLRVDGGTPIKVSALLFNADKSRQMIHSVNLPRETFGQVQNGRELHWRFSDANRTVTLKGMNSLMKVMDECVADLRKVWNVRHEKIDDPSEKVAAATPAGWTRAKANLAKYFDSDDYPGVAMQGNQDGLVAFALLVNEQGRVADCTVVKTSGVAALDAQSCILLRQRARFEPARDASGQPVKDALIGRIRWRL